MIVGHTTDGSDWQVFDAERFEQSGVQSQTLYDCDQILDSPRAQRRAGPEVP